MTKHNKPPVRRYKCPECGDETTWERWGIPTPLICKCGAEMLEVMGRKDADAGADAED